MVLVVAVFAIAGSGCASESTVPHRVREIVVPAGTLDRLNGGESVVLMPSVLRFRVGDTLRIRNEDVVEHLVGPYTVAAGRTVELRYGSPGRFEGMCTLAAGHRYRIIVER
jgi:hypothetical protein